MYLMGTDAKKIKKWNPIVVQWPITKMSLSPRAHCVALEHKYTGGQKSKQTVRSADGRKFLCSRVQAQGDLAFLLLVRREVVWKQPRPVSSITCADLGQPSCPAQRECGVSETLSYYRMKSQNTVEPGGSLGESKVPTFYLFWGKTLRKVSDMLHKEGKVWFCC